MKTVEFLGHQCCALENGTLKMLVTSPIGPRILSFGFKEGENLLAELPGGGVFHIGDYLLLNEE